MGVGQRRSSKTGKFSYSSLTERVTGKVSNHDVLSDM